MLLVLHRLVGSEHESLQRAAGAGATPFGADYAGIGDLLYGEWAFDVPKLFDVVALYGRTARPVVASLLRSLFTLQPSYFGDVAEALPVVAQTLKEVAARVTQLAAGPTADAAARQPQAGVAPLDLHKYLVDICVTVAELFKAYPDTCYCLMRAGTLVGLGAGAGGCWRARRGPFTVRVCCAPRPSCNFRDGTYDRAARCGATRGRNAAAWVGHGIRGASAATRPSRTRHSS